MNVLIISSSRNEIDPYYLSVAKSISQFLANYGYDLIFGGSSSSMMGVCYKEFEEKGRKIYSFTIPKYKDDLNNLKESEYFILNNTFDMKKDMFLNSDLVVCLAGGIGTLSELLSYIEEKKSNDNETPIIIYDENHFYDELFKLFEIQKKEQFVNDDDLNNFYITHNKEEFIDCFNRIHYGKRKVK